jgi:diguanylate cyclase (GGDEF)-like protein
MSGDRNGIVIGEPVMSRQAVTTSENKSSVVSAWNTLLSTLVSQGIMDSEDIAEMRMDESDKHGHGTADLVSVLNSRVSRLEEEIRNSEKLNRLLRNVQEIRLLYEIVQSLNSSAEPEKVFQSILNSIKKFVTYTNATLFIVDRETGKLVEIAHSGETVDLISNFDFELGNGFSAWVAKNGKPILLPRIHSRSKSSDSSIRSFLSVPLIYHRKIKGIINLSHSCENAFSLEHLRILTLIGTQLARTIESVISSHDMHYRAIYDELTGAYNRWYYQARLKEEMYRARRYHHPLSVIMLDIDHFKKFNDTYGHLAGDYVLRHIACFLKESLRECDIVGRYGGEEFLLILSETDEKKAYLIAERLRKGIEAWDGDSLDFEDGGITASFGIALLEDEDGSCDDLVNKADRAMYRAKRQGRNRICRIGDGDGQA